MLILATRRAMSDGANSRSRTMFFPCTANGSPLEPLPEAVGRGPAESLARSLLARSSFALSRNDPRLGERFFAATKTTRGGAPGGDPKGNDNLRPDSMHFSSQRQNLPRIFLRENSGAKTSNPTSMKGREPRQPHE